MKKNMYLFFSLSLFMFSCGKDDSPSVTPEEENKAPVIADQSFEFYETFTTKNIGTVKASDPDGDSLTFSIETNDNDLFVITSEGVLGLSGEKILDFETKTEHTITISVSDGTNEVSAKVKIIVLNIIDNLAEDLDSFVTTWKTTEDGESITIGLVEGLAYDFMIDWGDGTIANINKDEDIEHSYATAGDHVVAILGDFPGITMSGLSSAPKLMSIDQWGNNKWEFLNSAFADCENMVYKATDAPDLSQVSSLSSMFYFAKQFNGDIGDWDVSTIGNMSGMFEGASMFNQNIGGWNTESVTNMGFMFLGASNFNQDIGDWNTENVIYMSSMFLGASKFNQDIGGWNVSSVTLMRSMFNGASNFNQDMDDWNTENVTDMAYMFNSASSFNGNIGTWNVSSVTKMFDMFNGASNFNQDIGGWNTENVTNMARMFKEATLFDQDLGSWDIGSITAMENMFDNSGMSEASINNTVIGWSYFVENNGGEPAGITCGMAGMVACDIIDEVYDAAAYLVLKGWELEGLATDGCQ
ncbi:BspA family leucine-rich repeat surface protein [Flagellimonas sp. HMM57]|uniref:BspA family leucine-rich repeat surface protein n=1 Tax=unclassified Flagellimonas TaxID=2644544 RepID=UPI0013D42F90|nr:MULTISPECIES: BspA family leucine-rich repeat surface protein [unclassified Flagellimonas]UII75588.1 BspA family leucine-rich repeat surface protein [Flagellimonas sp. HMM57]